MRGGFGPCVRLRADVHDHDALDAVLMVCGVEQGMPAAH